MASPSPATNAGAHETAGDDEHALLDRALGGDGRAFATLVTPYLGLMFRVAARAAGNPALAEDAVQETLEILHRRLGTYKPGTSFKAFVAKIAVRRSRTLLRAELRRMRRELAQPEGDAPTTPEGALASEEVLDRIRSALGRLPSLRQRVVLLRLDAGLGYREIAQAVGTTEGSARVLVHHAVRTLTAELGDLLGKEPRP